MSTSSGSRVRRLGTIAMSSNPYARRPDLPIPISTSTVPPETPRRHPGTDEPTAQALESGGSGVRGGLATGNQVREEAREDARGRTPDGLVLELVEVDVEIGHPGVPLLLAVHAFG